MLEDARLAPSMARHVLGVVQFHCGLELGVVHVPGPILLPHCSFFCVLSIINHGSPILSRNPALIPPKPCSFSSSTYSSAPFCLQFTLHSLPQNPGSWSSRALRNGDRGKGQGFAVGQRGCRPERQEAEGGGAAQRLGGEAGERCGRRRRRARVQGGGHPQDGRLRSPLPPLLPRAQAPCLQVQGRPPGLQRLRRRAAGEPVPEMRGWRRIRSRADHGRRRLGGEGPVSARRLRALRRLLRRRRPQERVPARAVLVHGAWVRLHRNAGGARGAPPRRPLHARAQDPLRQGQSDPGASAGPGAPPARRRRGRRRRLPAHRLRARRHHRRVGGLRPGGRVRGAAVHDQAVGQRAAVAGAEPQGGHRAGGRPGDQQRHAGRRRAGGPDVVPDGAPTLPRRGGRVQGTATPRPGREDHVLIG